MCLSWHTEPHRTIGNQKAARSSMVVKCLTQTQGGGPELSSYRVHAMASHSTISYGWLWLLSFKLS